MDSQAHTRFARLCKVLLGGAVLVALQAAFAAITVTETVTPALGTYYSGASGRNFILNTDETIGGTDAGDYLSGAVTGQLTMVGENANVNIVAENITTSGGVSVNAVPCRYHTGPATTCDGAGINVAVKKNQSRTLYVGVNINTSQVHSGGDSASVTYDITVTII